VSYNAAANNAGAPRDERRLRERAALFPVFLKNGSVLYGSEYVLLALLQADLVERPTDTIIGQRGKLSCQSIDLSLNSIIGHACTR
jgi:hypothetical protein